MRIVFGIGNPGADYDGTRHNVGFRLLDRLGAQAERTWRYPAGTAAAWMKAQLAGWPVLLVKPLTFVNRCGPVLRQLRDRFGLEDAALLVVVDDVNLPVATLRLRAGGGDGGHNGLKSLTAHLETDAYPRLRIGVGPPPAGPLEAFVLGRFTPEEEPWMDRALARAEEAVALWVRLGARRAMSEINRRDLDPPRDPA